MSLEKCGRTNLPSACAWTGLLLMRVLETEWDDRFKKGQVDVKYVNGYWKIFRDLGNPNPTPFGIQQWFGTHSSNRSIGSYSFLWRAALAVCWNVTLSKDHLACQALHWPWCDEVLPNRRGPCKGHGSAFANAHRRAPEAFRGCQKAGILAKGAREICIAGSVHQRVYRYTPQTWQFQWGKSWGWILGYP